MRVQPAWAPRPTWCPRSHLAAAPRALKMASRARGALGRGDTAELSSPSSVSRATEPESGGRCASFTPRRHRAAGCSGFRRPQALQVCWCGRGVKGLQRTLRSGSRRGFRQCPVLRSPGPGPCWGQRSQVRHKEAASPCSDAALAAACLRPRRQPMGGQSQRAACRSRPSGPPFA